MLRVFSRSFMAAPAIKRQKLTGPLIGTHNGHFHADEALAVYLLRLLPTYANSPLIRTRDSALLEKCHTVVDVGGVYSSAANRYDHHQRDFNVTFPGHSTKLSSAGLVYLHFGKAIIAQCTGLSESSEDLEKLYLKIYDDFIEAFDANDNGITVYDSNELRKLGINKRFNDRGFSLASVVSRLNHRRDPPGSNHLNVEDDVAAMDKSKELIQEEEDSRFALASDFTGTEFLSELTDTFQSWLPARHIVEQAFQDRFKTHQSGAVLVLPQQKEGLPFMDHLYTLEAENHTPPSENVLYVIFAEGSSPASKWRVRAVSVEGDSFANRKSLPEKWRGVRDEELDEVSGIKGCIFVHASGFIGGNKTLAGALEMARLAVELPE